MTFVSLPVDMEDNNLPCVICFDTIRRKSKLSNSEKILHVFTKYFEVESLLSDPVKEPLPFCNLCQLELDGILKLHELVESLQQNIKRQINGLTAKLIESVYQHENRGKSSEIFEDRSVSFRQNIRNNKGLETIEVRRKSPLERKILMIRRSICNRKDHRDLSS